MNQTIFFNASKYVLVSIFLAVIAFVSGRYAFADDSNGTGQEVRVKPTDDRNPVLHKIPISAIIEKQCGEYAKNAVSQYDTNLQVGCGLTSPPPCIKTPQGSFKCFEGQEWHSEYVFHYNWCTQGNLKNVAKETTLRQAALDKCVVNKCDIYANDAVSLNVKNLNEECGYKDEGWSSEHAYHYNWCMQGNVKNAARENTLRQTKLDKCNACKEYAKDAQKQEQYNQKLQCGYKKDTAADKWSLDTNYHFKWCMPDNQENADIAKKSRDNDLNQCIAKKCDNFAKAAVSQEDENRLKKCGFTPGRGGFGKDYAYYYKDCTTSVGGGDYDFTRSSSVLNQHQQLLSTCVTPIIKLFKATVLDNDYARLDWDVQCNNSCTFRIAHNGGYKDAKTPQNCISGKDSIIVNRERSNNKGDALYTLTLQCAGTSQSKEARVPVWTGGSSSSGFSALHLYNCNSDRHTVYVWVEDLTKSTVQQKGPIAHQYDNWGTCHGNSAPTISTFEDSHIYHVTVVDPQKMGCGGVNDPNNVNCQKTIVPQVSGAKNGPPYVLNSH